MSSAIQSRLRERRRRRRIILACVVLILIGLFCYGTVTLMRKPFLRIQTITVAGSDSVATSSLAQFARGELSGNYWHFFPKDNILLYPKNKLAADVLSTFPSLRTASVHSDTFTSITLSVSERKPSALWCGDGGPTASSTPSSACLLLDEGGVAYAQAPTFSEPVYISYYGVLQGDSARLPAQFLTPSQFRSLAALVAALIKQADIGMPARVSVDENNDVTVHFGGGFNILFALGDDGGKILQHFTLALSSAPFTKHPLSAFQYLDLRFGDKLYYKFK